MNDEIKEIIMQIQTAIEFKENPMPMNYSISINDMKTLLDYITNLQEENERLNDELKRLHNLLNSQAYQDLDIYKSRNEKAISYYYKTLKEYETKRAIMPLEAVEMFNILEGNK